MARHGDISIFSFLRFSIPRIGNPTFGNLNIGNPNNRNRLFLIVRICDISFLLILLLFGTPLWCVRLCSNRSLRSIPQVDTSGIK